MLHATARFPPAEAWRLDQKNKNPSASNRMIGTYSPGLIALSLIVAVAASYVAFALAAQISSTKGWQAAYWLPGGAIAMGTGIWSMHFIGMLAFELPIPMSYDMTYTVASLLIAIFVSGFALYVVSTRKVGPLTLAIGGTTMGLGIAAMHYTGMAAMEIAPPLTYDIGLVFVDCNRHSRPALALDARFRCAVTPWPTSCGSGSFGALAMGTGIAAMHYTAMAAANFAPGTICTAPSFEVDQQWLAIAVAASCFLFLGATMLILTIDIRLAHQLDDANARIAALAREDPLTGLANRRTFLESLDAAFRSRARDGASFAILFLDLDGFKDVNDTLGHAIGDALLLEVAARLKGAFARRSRRPFGGDEFAILQRGVSPADSGTWPKSAPYWPALRDRPRRDRCHCEHRHCAPLTGGNDAGRPHGAGRPRTLSRQGRRQKLLPLPRLRSRSASAHACAARPRAGAGHRTRRARAALSAPGASAPGGSSGWKRACAGTTPRAAPSSPRLSFPSPSVLARLPPSPIGCSRKRAASSRNGSTTASPRRHSPWSCPAGA
jgi:NO-binding membrane sensor protein with MHYT domain/GGDEF domain-containing protein